MESINDHHDDYGHYSFLFYDKTKKTEERYEKFLNANILKIPTRFFSKLKFFQ